ncbi:hypothetical protein DPMN_163572 [Dreissena polymorpha]|uniref:Uncharacterized protein n=1 Tax=Dreissena polymorpha TaxID=45954 RepID=A0A9D4IUP9_DREPO|nr:hypothetical protein DPMN_163572 [Dreissena polymorpha]
MKINHKLEPTVKTGTWKEASECNETYPAAAEVPVGDYLLRIEYQNYVLTGYSERTIDRCGMLYVNGTVQFVKNYSWDYLSAGLSLSAQVLLKITPGTLKYSTNYPEYGQYTQKYRRVWPGALERIFLTCGTL